MQIAAQNQALEEDLEGIRALLLHNDGETIGNFFSNKTTIKEGELNRKGSEIELATCVICLITFIRARRKFGST